MFLKIPLPITPCRSAPPWAADKEVKEIAQAAIDSINQLTSLFEHGSSTTGGTPRIPSNAHVTEAAHRAKRQLTASETTFIRLTQPANS